MAGHWLGTLGGGVTTHPFQCTGRQGGLHNPCHLESKWLHLPHGLGEKWLHSPCGLGVRSLGRKQSGYRTTALGSPVCEPVWVP